MSSDNVSAIPDVFLYSSLFKNARLLLKTKKGEKRRAKNEKSFTEPTLDQAKIVVFSPVSKSLTPVQNAHKCNSSLQCMKG